VVASEYPGIPTDVQAPFGACLTTVSGLSFVEERVYPGHRFTHVEELVHMGADLTLQDSMLTIQGSPLTGCNVHAADIRAGGALVVAALAAKGTTVITGLKFIKRGYENFAERLRNLGADIHEEEILQMTPQTGTYGD
jgi:UDP-N-acetylglucosamine 1-carboxyvinyltransferase